MKRSPSIVRESVNLFWRGAGMALVLASLAMPTTGCIIIAHVSINDEISNEKVAFIHEGRTTFKDVVEELGAPTRIVGIKSGGTVAVYQFLDIRYSSVNYGYFTKFAPQTQGQSLDLVLAGGGLGIDTFEVTFNERWIAQHYAFAKHAGASHYVFWPF